MVLLFLFSFLAATIIPFSSEAHFALIIEEQNFIAAVIVATLGNTLGGLTSYLLGWLAKWRWIEKHLKVKEEKVNKFKVKIQKYGAWMGLLCWLPFIGDIIAVGLGIFKVHPIKVAITMTIGKAFRYLTIGLLLI